MRTKFLWSALLLGTTSLVAQPLPNFKANWIDVPGISQQDYGVYHFRRSFDLLSKPATFVVHVSGDNRYQLFVNGKRVSTGPARGDLTHWRFENVDLTPQLKAGRNVLAAVVWNDGPGHAVAQISNRTGFLLDADGVQGDLVRTGTNWKCFVDRAYTPLAPEKAQLTGYRAVAANERFDGSRYPWGWEQAAFNDAGWLAAEKISPAALRDARDAPNRWMLVPTTLPPQEEKAERFRAIRRAEGVPSKPELLEGRGAMLVPAHARASLLLDQGYETTGYPELITSGGKGAQVRLRYAEALFLHKGDKGNREEIAGKQLFGDADVYLPGGGNRQLYRPLFWRTWRYLELEVETADAPLTLNDIRSEFTAYPFQSKASFRVGDAKVNQEMQKILATGWRTARLCAHESYMDCPYYEQLQYAGDARIQMRVSLYMTGDARLMKNGIEQLNSSRTPEGLTFSRAPSALQQYIPPFSLWWIGMVHDYWMNVDDAAFVKEMLPGVEAILSFYARYQKSSGSLERLPWWNFVDWVKAWKNGEPPSEADGSGAAALDLQLLMAYRWASELESGFGLRGLSEDYAARAEALKQLVLQQDYDATRGLFADQPSHRTYSQQVNTLAVLAHLLPEDRARGVLEKTIADGSLAPSSVYFRAYTNAALRETGLGDRYLPMLGPWRTMLSQGLTTWAEWDGPDARSDCHAWGASPNYELFRTVAGIESAAPGFHRVRIAPNLGALEEVEGRIPHPAGEIVVRLHKSGETLAAEIALPRGTTGDFLWQGKRKDLVAGNNRVTLTAKR